jgi:hypothetical protein
MCGLPTSAALENPYVKQIIMPRVQSRTGTDESPEKQQRQAAFTINALIDKVYFQARVSEVNCNNAHIWGFQNSQEVNEDIPHIQYINVIHEPRWLSRYSDWATGWATKKSGIIPGRGKRFFSSLYRPDQLLGPPNPLNNGYRGLFPRG